MLRLDFTYADLGIPEAARLTRRASISGVQEKVQLKKRRGGYDVVASGGDAILKPVPRHTSAELARDIPVNEFLTMTLAARLFGIRTAECTLATLADGEYAYLTQRFDRRGGESVRQEDFCQLAGRSEETHGPNYKYDFSYEELAGLVRRFCPSAMVENPKVFRIILFNYLFGNGDAHLKNFSLYESAQGDYILTPAYDLLNTAVHFPNEPSATGLAFFADGRFTPSYEALGFYSSADFLELGRAFGLGEGEVRELLALFGSKKDAVEAGVEASALSEEAKARYLALFRDRLSAIRR